MASFPVDRVAAFVKTSGEPRFETRIPREFAHKRAVEEIFLTDVIVDEDRERVLVCAQLPRSHTLYNEVENGIHDLLLLLEAARQGMTVYGHVRLEVAEETAFVMSSLRVEVVDLDALRQGEGPAELVIDVPFGEERRNGRGQVRGYTLRGAGRIDGCMSIALSGEALLIPESLYQRVRRVRVAEGVAAPSSPEPAEPAAVGRCSPRNVVVGDVERANGELRCALVVDTTHPAFFDHPLDHVPGMLMLEAARQAALLYVKGLGWPPTESVLDACEAHFTQYAALSPPARCRVQAGEPFGGEPAPAEGTSRAEYLRVYFSQAEVDVGHIDLRLRRVAAG